MAENIYGRLETIINNTPIDVAFIAEEPISDEELLTTAKPTNTLHIINPASNFVVVTYWWGRNNDNKNTARPCLEFYEKILSKPFNLALLFDVDLSSKPQFDWLRWLATHQVAKKFYEDQAAYYANESHGKLDKEASKKEIEAAKKEILKIVVRAVSAPASVQKVGEREVQVRPHLSYLQEFQHFGYRRHRLEEELERGERSPEDIRDEIKALVAAYEASMAQLKLGLRPFLRELETTLQHVAPIKYHKMISNWKRACMAAGCNHMAVEYSEFTQPGGYQLAINAKPLFIKKALERCTNVQLAGDQTKSFAVVYIDGDMTIDRYPKIFDMEDVDFMARGWNIDPRGSWKHVETSISVDPYVFETSGGIMYFSHTPESGALLRAWIQETKKPHQAGKADDRIISLIFNAKRLLAPMKIIQLPVEYLWLSMDYDYAIPAAEYKREQIYVSHPECLTSEDTAAASGASSVRTPKYYEGIESALNRSERLYESVMFPTRDMADQFRQWLNYIGTATYFEDDGELAGESPFYVYKYGDFGDKNAVLRDNIRQVGNTPNVSTSNNKDTKLIIMDETTFTIPNILRQYTLGHSILYIPSAASEGYLIALQTILKDTAKDRLEFMFVDKNFTTSPEYAYQYKINLNEPMYIRYGNPALYYLFALLKDVNEIERCLHDGYQFLSRIRCHALKRVRTARITGGGKNNNDDGKNTQDAYDLLYAPQKAGGRKRTARRRVGKIELRKRKSRKHVRK